MARHPGYHHCRCGASYALTAITFPFKCGCGDVAQGRREWLADDGSDSLIRDTRRLSSCGEGGYRVLPARYDD